MIEVAEDPLPGRKVWLTCFWGFDPSLWGGLGFTREADRTNYLQQAPGRSLMAIYVTKAKGPEEMRGKVVGLLELTKKTGPMQNFTSPLEWRKAQLDPVSVDKWTYGIQASRAWWIAPEEWVPVDQLLPETYASNNAQVIGGRGVPVRQDEVGNLFALTLAEVPVYGQSRPVSQDLTTLHKSLSPTAAVHPGAGERWIGEVDGPKHIYVMRLEGNYSHFLGRTFADVSDKHIIKVGFSKSPELRRRQIQSAYPACAFNWEIHKPDVLSAKHPFDNAAEAIIAEDAMKKRLVEEGAESLGGEFFLVNDDQLVRVWNAGRFALQRHKDAAGS